MTLLNGLVVGEICKDLVRDKAGNRVAVCETPEIAIEFVSRWNAHERLVESLRERTEAACLKACGLRCTNDNLDHDSDECTNVTDHTSECQKARAVLAEMGEG